MWVSGYMGMLWEYDSIGMLLMGIWVFRAYGYVGMQNRLIVGGKAKT